MMKKKEFKTIREYLYWNYSNMGMAHFALDNAHARYETIDYMIRAKLYKGLVTGNMHIATLYDEEKYKCKNKTCCYCGSTDSLSLDHLISKYQGGQDTGDNLVLACKSCNSSKNKKDLLLWFLNRNCFPPILVLRRYLKLAYIHFEKIKAIDLAFDELYQYVSLFRIDLLPYEYPQPKLLRL